MVREAISRYQDQTTDVLLQALFLNQKYNVTLEDVDPALRRRD
jgi:hypothetical protein